jgi:hypothetical protein
LTAVRFASSSRLQSKYFVKFSTLHNHSSLHLSRHQVKLKLERTVASATPPQDQRRLFLMIAWGLRLAIQGYA